MLIDKIILPLKRLSFSRETIKTPFGSGAGATATINESCSFSVTDESYIDVTVINRNSIMAHCEIGSARVGLQNVLQCGTEALEAQITDNKSYAAGSVELRLEASQVCRACLL